MQPTAWISVLPAFPGIRTQGFIRVQDQVPVPVRMVQGKVAGSGKIIGPPIFQNQGPCVSCNFLCPVRGTGVGYDYIIHKMFCAFQAAFQETFLVPDNHHQVYLHVMPFLLSRSLLYTKERMAASAPSVSLKNLQPYPYLPPSARFAHRITTLNLRSRVRKQ